jgi:glycosyltransferase involved in cell wall biosynthesis
VIDIAVVIPAYNAEPFLGETLESVLRQTLRLRKVVVVDDGSRDGTAAVAERFGAQVTLVRQENQGVARARNVGAAHTDTEWLAFLDADDVWQPEKIERQAEVACEEKVAAVLCGMRIVNDQGRTLEERPPGADLGLEALLRHDDRIPQGLASTILMRRDLFNAVQGFDPSLATMADWDLMLRLRLEGPFGYVDEPLVLYRRHVGNMSRNIGMLERESVVVLAKAFAHPKLPAELRRLRKECFAWNDLVLAGSCFWAGEKLAAVRHGVSALRGNPALLGRVAAFPIRAAARVWRGEPRPGTR